MDDCMSAGLFALFKFGLLKTHSRQPWLGYVTCCFVYDEVAISDLLLQPGS